MNCRLSASLFLLLSFACGWAQDSLSLSRKIGEDGGVSSRFPGFLQVNPATVPYTLSPALTQLEAGAGRDSDPVALLQTGDAGREAGMKAQTLMLLSEGEYVWGTVSYRNAGRENVRWNESADYHLVYPYVMADSIGGDIALEEYVFKGGYARRYQRISWGILASYRARLEYRQVDPRPKNTGLELNLYLGATVGISDRYRLAAGFHGMNYKQRNDVTFLSVAGKVAVYHLLGMDRYMYRFGGSMLSNQYSGASYGGSLSFFPSGHDGWAAQLVYDRFSCEKSFVSNTAIPLMEISEHTLSGVFSYRRRTNSGDWGVKSEVSWQERQGTQGIPDKSLNINIIAYARQYGNRIQTGRLSGFYSHRAGKNIYSLLSGFTVHRQKEKYNDPAQSMEIPVYSGDIGLQVFKPFNKTSAQIHIDLSHSESKDPRLNLAPVSENDLGSYLLMRDVVELNFKHLSASRTALSGAFRLDYLLRPQWSLFCKCAYLYAWNKGYDHSYGLQLSAGITF